MGAYEKAWIGVALLLRSTWLEDSNLNPIGLSGSDVIR